ncbi:MAG: sigma-70 family RNA polymerase sigma factor [Balneolaceae bacterium]
MSKVDYSELVDALVDGDREKANELVKEIFPRLEKYLRVVMGADDISARECVQQAFVDVYDQIQMDNIRDHKYIFGYFIKACRNEYLRYSSRQHKFLFDSESIHEYEQQPQQIQNLLDEERQRLLRECIEELEEESRELIVYFFENPDATTKEASKHFNITGANVRTRKYRITQKLHRCYKWKSSE